MNNDRISSAASDEPAAGGENLLLTQARERWEARKRFEQAGLRLSQAQENENKRKIDYLESRLNRVAQEHIDDAERKFNEHIDQLRKSVEGLSENLKQVLVSERNRMQQTRDEVSHQLEEGVDQAILHFRESRQAQVDRSRDKIHQIADEFDSQIDRPFAEAMPCSLLAAALNAHEDDLPNSGGYEQITPTIPADHLHGDCGSAPVDKQHTCYLAIYLGLHDVDSSKTLRFDADRTWDSDEVDGLFNLLRIAAGEMDEFSEVRRQLAQLDLNKPGSAEILSFRYLRPDDAEQLLGLAEELWGGAGATFPDAEAPDLTAMKQHLEVLSRQHGPEG